MKRENITMGLRIDRLLSTEKGKLKVLKKGQSLSVSIDGGFGQVELSPEGIDFLKTLAINTLERNIAKLKSELEAL